MEMKKTWNMGLFAPLLAPVFRNWKHGAGKSFSKNGGIVEHNKTTHWEASVLTIVSAISVTHEKPVRFQSSRRARDTE
jgi:hypothetical protein